MPLSPAQLATLKAAIFADPVLSTYPATPDGAYGVAEAMDVAASPTFTVWKTSVNPDDIMRNGMDWTRVDNLTVGKSRIWEWMTRLGSFNPSRANIRAGIDAAWTGTAADLAVRATVYTHCKRPATIAEKLFATGTGSDASPATMAVEGRLNYLEVLDAMRLP
jgi:hypothetical protein